MHGKLLVAHASALLIVAAALGACDSDETTGPNNTTSSSSGTGAGATGGSTTGGGGSGAGSSGGSGGSGGGGTTTPSCDALPPPTGNVINVTPAEAGNLQSIASNAQTGDTISLADGTYDMSGTYIWISTPGVTLRSASGNREAVILDGNYSGSEIVTVAASDCTIADITIQKAYTHPIHVVTSGADTLNTLIYNIHIIDAREQAIKINPGGGGFIDDTIIACSHLELTDQGRPQVQPNPGGCYTGGVDAHETDNLVVRDCLIEGYWCNNGLSEHGVHCWRGCRGTVVERTTFINNARAIGFGMATSGNARAFSDCPGVSGYIGHYGGVARNNFIFADDAGLFASSSGHDCGICFWSACKAKALHNTIVSTNTAFSSIEWRFDTSQDVEIANNIVTHGLLERNGASTSVNDGNLESAPLSTFVDGPGGNLHLDSGATAAIDQGISIAAGDCDDDIDGDARSGARDIGADEIP